MAGAEVSHPLLMFMMLVEGDRRHCGAHISGDMLGVVLEEVLGHSLTHRLWIGGGHREVPPLQLNVLVLLVARDFIGARLAQLQEQGIIGRHEAPFLLRELSVKAEPPGTSIATSGVELLREPFSFALP